MTFDQKSYMKEYRKKYMPSYRAANIEMFREFDKRRYQLAKEKAWTILGSVCSNCGESEDEFLTIDHIDDDGASERLRKSKRQLFQDIVNDRVDISKYRVQCRNCNSGRANEISFTDDPVSNHSFTGDPCDKCGYPKLVMHGIRKRTECRRCIKVRNREFRMSALALYDSKCKCCDENNKNKLTFDHINNDGSSKRYKDHCGTVYFYRNLLSGKLDSFAYQLLCWNCNFSKHLGGGICVHQRKVEVSTHGF